MLDNRAAMNQSLNRMEKFNIHSSQHLKQAVDFFTKEIEELRNQESRNLALKINISKEVGEKIKNVIE